MSKINSKLKYLSSFIFVSSFAVLLLILSFLNLKSYFADRDESKVLSAEKEDFDEEQYWTAFLKSNPSYFPGYIELAKIQITKKDIAKATETILKAKELNPNSPLITELEQSLK